MSSLSDIEPLLLTGDQAAKQLAISPRTLFSMRIAGEIPFVTPGKRSIRYDREDLRAWIDQNKQVPKPSLN